MPTESRPDLPALLLVDDEPLVLEALARVLRRQCRVRTATSGAQGLERLAAEGPFAVVLSDMRMPGMDGATFLRMVRERTPDTVRMLLTGYAEIDAAIAAINDGGVFRFLTKPCPPPQLLAAVQAGLRQYELTVAERVLLEQTLTGSVRALTEILALSNPIAFGRAMRLQRRAVELGRVAGATRWEIAVAAPLSQVPCVVLPDETARKLALGLPLSGEEESQLRQFPAIIEKLLSPIPRLERVRAVLRYQHKHFDGSGSPHDAVAGEDIPLGARILLVVSDYDTLEVGGTPWEVALDTMEGREGRYDPALLEAFGELCDKEHAVEIVEVSLPELHTGMVLADDIRTASGVVVVARGHPITARIIDRLHNFPGVQEPIRVAIPERVTLF